MKKIYLYIILLVAGLLSVNLSAQKIDRIEPLCWWEGMQTNLQLMIYGSDLQNSGVRVLEKGLEIKKIYNADSPNYLFVDVEIERAGTYTLELTKEKKKTTVKYEIHNRRQNSGNRVGFTTVDVIYLLMPDRYANGDPANDALAGDKNMPGRTDMEARHGGDIQGIINHLDYIHDLGATTIWATPVLEDNLYYHQYSCSDYYKVDEHLGTNKLYKEMVSKAHDKGLKVIQDVVPNHCGAGHWWMSDLPFQDWINRFDTFTKSNYALHAFSDPYATDSDKELCKRGWFVESLPDMNLSNPFVMQYLIQSTIWWIEYADLDGLRVDTYYYMGEESAVWTKGIRNEYPKLSLVGEVWGNEPPVISYWLEKENDHKGFNSQLPMAMDFPLERSLVMGFASDNEAWGGGMKSIYTTLSQDFVYRSPLTSLVVFADNHDIDRIYNMLGKNLAKTKMAMTLIATTRGTPQIYYGTELLFENDKRGGAHQSRQDFQGGWAGDSLNLFLEKDRSMDQAEMYNHVRTLLQFRKHTEVLHAGKLTHYHPQENVYVYFRYNDSECVMVVINASKEKKKIDWKRFSKQLEGKTTGTDILSKTTITNNQEVELTSESSMVIHFK